MLWAWAKRRHPDKPAKWVKKRYFRDDGYWTLHEGAAQLVRRAATPVTRLVKVRGTASPLDPEQRDYWLARRKRAPARQAYSKGKPRTATPPRWNVETLPPPAEDGE
jgi:RNA-directed DNA polymerase